MTAHARRGIAILASAAALWAIAAALVGPGREVAVPGPGVTVDRAAHQREKKADETRVRFEQAVVMLHARQYRHAVTALHRVLELAPELPEAHVNMGYALLGLQRADAARDFFESAIALRPAQANAYYGLAMAQEARGDLESALGAMRSYLHTSSANDAHRSRARAALWEWERALGRAGAPGAAATAAPR
jgi:Flp pilus assembly protein TadD